jgi:integrase
MAHLTKSLVESAVPPKSGQLFLRDDEITGFGLRVTSNGSKSFVWEGRIDGRTCRDTLGRFPDLSVLEARAKALEYKAKIAQGENPVGQRDAERAALRAEKTFAQLVDEYLTLHAKPHKRSWREDERMIRRYLPSSWSSRRLSDFSRHEMVRLHQTIGHEHGRYAANRLVALLRTMFNRARLWGLLKEENPVRGIKLFHEEKRERFLTADEIARLNQALMSEPDWRWRAFFPLSLLLGTRRGELITARWADIDFGQAVWRLPNTKSGRPHLLPLPRAAVQILKRLPSRNNSEWLFPGEKTNSSITAPSNAWQRIRERAGLNGDENVPNTAVRQHDLRRTLGSWLAASGYSLPLIGRALNHANVSTTAIYARLDLDPVRRALEDNATMMLAAGRQTVDAQTKRSNNTQRRRNVSHGVDLATLVKSVPGRPISLSREELYRRVWSNPVGSVAREFGISGRGLAKICARFEIPVPPRGYWAKIAAGKRAPEILLPSTESKLPSEIRIATLR